MVTLCAKTLVVLSFSNVMMLQASRNPLILSRSSFWRGTATSKVSKPIGRGRNRKKSGSGFPNDDREPQLGAPRIHGEPLMLGFDVSQMLLLVRSRHCDHTEA